MEYKVGSLADLISGTHNAASDKKHVEYVPFQYKKTTPAEVTQKTAPFLGKKRKVHWNEETIQSGGGKRKKEFSEGNTEEEVDYEDEILPTRPPKRRKAKFNLDAQREMRTLFVKNIPYIVDKKKLKKAFKKYGTIECIRFRCAPQGDTRVPKKVTVIKKEFHQDRTNISAFIRFNEKESVGKALEANGSLIEGHRIFVDRAAKEKKRDQSKAIFLGNVPFAAEENEIWNTFAECGEIEDIRIVRDRETGLGKGFAFVNFKSSDAVELAIHLQGIKLRENELRVMRVTKKLKQTSNQQKNNIPRSQKTPLKRNEYGRNWKSNKKNLENKVVKEKTVSNEKYVNRKDGKTFKIKHQHFNKKEEGERIAVETSKKQNTPRQSFQGQTLSDKKKKKKTNKNEQRKKKIAKMLTTR